MSERKTRDITATVGKDHETSGDTLSFELSTEDVQDINDVPYVYLRETDLITDVTTMNTGIIQSVHFKGKSCFVTAKSKYGRNWDAPAPGKVYMITHTDFQHQIDNQN